MVAVTDAPEMDESGEVSEQVVPEETAEMGETLEEKKLQFENFFNEGKRALLLNDFQLATETLSSAAQLSVEIYGELEKEVFEPHFYYGKALLELERLQKGNMITEPIGGQEEEDEEDSDQDVVEEENGEAAGSSSSKVNENGTKKTEGSETPVTVDTKVENEPVKDQMVVTGETREATAVDAKNEKEKQEDGTATNPETCCVNGQEENEEATVAQAIEKQVLEETIADETGEAKEMPDDDDEAGPLQLAWEVLEVARAVCDRNISEEGWKEKKVEVLLILAQCSLESENYEQTVEDLRVCIEIASTIFDSDDRRLAEANYQAGQACNLSGDFWNSADYFSKARDLLEARCSNLERKMDAVEADKKDAYRKEIEELRALVPDLQLKIDDCRESAETEDLKKKAMERLARTFMAQQGSVSEGMSIEKPVDDITNLVRKKGQKRNLDGADSEEAKRSKTEEDETL